MQPLSLDLINAITPYKVWSDGVYYYFSTDYQVELRVDFDEDRDVLTSVSYWFNISNISQKASPNDKKVMPTIWAIIEEFFRMNPDVLLYICDSEGDHEAMRARLFAKWYRLYDDSEQYLFHHAEIPDEGKINYVAIIVPKSNPLAERIVQEFDERTEMFKTKPH